MTDIAALRRTLGVSDAQMVNDGLKITVAFFADVLATDATLWIDYLRGIDFHHPVTAPTLEKHTTLVRYESSQWREIPEGGSITPFAFFTTPGVSPFHTGTSWPSWYYKVFNVVTPTTALMSTASTLSWHPFGDAARPTRRRFDRQSRVGGGTQYILSRADWPKLLRVSALHRA